MAISNGDKDVLEEIVAANGNCMDSKRCARCPFRAICLPEFLNTVTPSPEQRLKMSQDVLAHHYLIDDEVGIAEIQRDFLWDKQ